MTENIDSPVNPGDVLAGKYRVEAVLGAGGMGIVIKARHIELESDVALKFMRPDAMKDPANVARFQREARAAVRLRGENSVRVLDVGRLDGGAPYMVMEFLIGRDLATIIEQDGPMSVAAAIDCIMQACRGIGEAHALGIVHRDLKPQNLFMAHTLEGTALVKVVDFGLAKVVDPLASGGLTDTATVMGSPNYMSPEQLRASRDVDSRSDIWSLGVCLHELVTGAPPFEAQSVADLCAQVLTAQPALDHETLRAAPALRAVVMRCMAKAPADRFQSVADLAQALRDCVGRVSSVDRPVRVVVDASSVDVDATLAHSDGVRARQTRSPQISGQSATGLGMDVPPQSDRTRTRLAVGGVLLAIAVSAGAFVIHRGADVRSLVVSPVVPTDIARAAASSPSIAEPTTTAGAPMRIPIESPAASTTASTFPSGSMTAPTPSGVPLSHEPRRNAKTMVRATATSAAAAPSGSIGKPDPGESF